MKLRRDPAQCRDGRCRIAMLMTSEQFRHRQIEQAALVFKNKPATLLADEEIAVRHAQWRTGAARLSLQHIAHVIALFSDDSRTVPFENAGFLACDAEKIGAEEFRVVVRD